MVLIEFFGTGNLGAVLGVFFTASSISAVCGPLVAGLIIDHTGSYDMGCWRSRCVMGSLAYFRAPDNASGYEQSPKESPRAPPTDFTVQKKRKDAPLVFRST